jgi:hypothetical protein
MVPPELPADVLEFLDKFIDSIPELETLLIMSDDAQRRWTEPALAARIYVPIHKARSILEALHRRRLIVTTDEGYHFSPIDEAHRALIERVAVTYRSNLVAIANFVHRKAPASIMEFARAFDLKKDH